MSFAPRIEHLGPTDPSKLQMDDKVRESSSPTTDLYQAPHKRIFGLRRRTWITISAAAFVCLLAIIIGVAVHVSKINRYPNYTRLNYSLKDEYSGRRFFDNFDFFSQTDPANGKVIYVNEAEAVQSNLTYASDTAATIRVDNSDKGGTVGRRSVRIESKKHYDSGLFIFDVAYSPYGCGTWPALWLTDTSNWPKNGEIDVMEAVNTAATGNQMTLHTGQGCKMNVKQKQYGHVLDNNCYNKTNDNAGCGVRGKPETYGREFNRNGGGVYAMEYRDAGIRFWFWSRTAIPNDISSPGASPDPSTWGKAIADFPSTECDIGSHFRNQSIIANIDLCGPWAGKEKYYSQQAQCPDTCETYIANADMSNVFWQFNSFKVYQAS